jgi:magnesium chelatase subunit H
MRFVLVTLDHHLSGAFERAQKTLRREVPSLEMRMHVAADWTGHPEAAERCREDLRAADLVLVTQLFLEDQAAEVVPTLAEHRERYDALVCAMSCPEVMRLTRMGRFSMGGPRADAEEEGGSAWSPAAIFRRLRGSRTDRTTGEAQVRQLRRVPQLLRFVPGTAQDVRAYYLVLQYWLAGSEGNLADLVRHLVHRYAASEAIRKRVKPGPPAEYPETGVYHPELPGNRMAEDPDAVLRRGDAARPVVGLLLMRSYLLAGNTAHYDAVIRALEARGLRTLPAFAYGLDSRPALERVFRDPRTGRPRVDALVSLTGFSLVGGPAYNDAAAAREQLAALDVPYLAAQPLEFQTVEAWRDDPRGLSPLQATLMVAIPELDGATGPAVFAGKGESGGPDAQPVAERVERLADRVAKWTALRRTPKAERKVGVVLFCFPPNAGNAGTAAFLAVWESLHNVLRAMRDDGYTVDVPASPDALRRRVLEGNAERTGALANVHARVPADQHVRRETWLREIEAAWGPAPGRQQSDGSAIQVLGERFGNVFVGLQPAFGYEGDPMRLLFERGFAPTHAFSAFYRWLREDFGAHALLHFGTHGALEFMPGKQVGLAAECWPDRLIADVPNVYLYASNNPSEGTLAKRRAAATLVSYLTPSVTHAGLYRGLLDLKASLDRWRSLPPDADAERAALAPLVQAQAAAVDLADAEPAWDDDAQRRVDGLTEQVLELEYSLIPHGLHVVGAAMSEDERADTLAAMAGALTPRPPLPMLGEGENDKSRGTGSPPPERGRVAALRPPGGGLPDAATRSILQALVRAGSVDAALAAARGAGLDADGLRPELERLAGIDRLLAEDHEIPALLRALDGRWIAPAPGGDLLRTPEVLPTGRNVYGFDPFRVPSAFATREGRRQAERLLERHRADHGRLPETVAMVLWGTDNMKSEGAPIAQAMALLGATPRFDSYGRLAGAALLPLDELGRARVDVVLTLSGVFRDLLPLQTRMLAEAAALAAAVDEPDALNPVRRHARETAAELGCTPEEAALRVFGNAEGAYGANVNNLVESGRWSDEEELAETFVLRKAFAYGPGASAQAAPALFRRALAGAELAFQNLDSVELGVQDVDQYFDGLGGMSRAVRRERGEAVPTYVGDSTRGEARVRTLAEQVALETRTRTLNPKWYEALLKHGYEGVRQVESRVTAALGWSATTGEVPQWVYTQTTRVFVLDAEMRGRLAGLNPAAASRMAGRLLEANERGYWTPDDDTLDALRRAADELEDRLEGITPEAAA